MAKFKYLGKDNSLVGRFGRLKHGQVVELWQSEADYLESHSMDGWEKVASETDTNGIGTIVPAVTPFYDLTRVFWLREAHASLRRMSRPELLQVCRALTFIEANMLPEAQIVTQSREALIELVHEEVRRLCWDQPGFSPAEPPSKKPARTIRRAKAVEAEDEPAAAEDLQEPASEEQAPVEQTEPEPAEANVKSFRKLKRERKA